MVTYKALPPRSGICLNGFPNSPAAKPMPVSQHTKTGSFYSKRSPSAGRMPILLICNKMHQCQVGSCLLSRIVFPFRQNHLKRQTIILRVLDGWVQSKSRSEGVWCLVSSCSDRVGDSHLHYLMTQQGSSSWTEDRDSSFPDIGGGQC